MKANELRIGNWVSFDEYCKVDYIGENLFWCVDKGGASYKSTWAEIEPIPLTPEILEKAGFSLYSKHSYWNYRTGNNFFLSMWALDEQVAGFEKKGVFYWGDGFLEVHYLHQLQNLYFCLTGEELNIQL